MQKFMSRKLLAFVLSSFVVPWMASMEMPPDVIQWFIGLAGMYIGGQSAVDAVMKRGMKEVCSHGPVFKLEDMIWE